MATRAQIEANQANAQLSTGPKTAEGKARVAHNAVRHGLTAKHLVVRDDEREEFESLRDQLLAEHDPQGPTESIIFDQLLHAAWNLQRFSRLEAEASLGTLDDFTDPQTTSVLDRLGRYQACNQRAFYRALHELRALQTNRVLRQSKDLGPDVPVMADIAKLTKQSQSKPAVDPIVEEMNRGFTEIERQFALRRLRERIRQSAEENN